MLKIVLIGAGSSSFSVELLKDISSMPDLAGCALALVDIDTERLEFAHKMVSKYSQETGMNISISSTTDRREALDGADYVICAVKIGGYDPLEAERAISEDMGYYRGVGDRVSCYYGGIGAYHQIKFMNDLAQDMVELCPEAWLVQTANPVFEATNYALRHTNVKAVGVCHGHNGYRSIAKTMGLDPDRASAIVCGFNHITYMKSFMYDNKDAYPLLDEWIEKESEKYWKSDKFTTVKHIRAPDHLSPGAVDAYKMYGLMPIGDAIRAGSPWWHNTDLDTKVKWYGPGGGFDSEHGWKLYLDDKDIQYEKLRNTVNSDVSILEVFGQTPTVEQHVPFIDSLANNNDRILTLNVLNNGAITGLPDDILVEIHVRCNGHGQFNLNVGAFPPKVMNNIMLPRLARAENIMDAFLRGDRSVLYLMVADDPRTRSFEQAKSLVDKLLAQPWNEEADKHYR